MDTTTPASGLESSIKVTTRHDRSTAMFMLQHLIKPLKAQVVKPPKTSASAGSPQLEPCKKASKRCDIKERSVNDIYLYDIAGKDTSASKALEAGETPLKRLYYFAGGGWQSPATSEHWQYLAELAVCLPATIITLVSYPLAPDSAAPVAFPQVMTLYRTLMQDAEVSKEHVLMAGDSAGANIVLTVVLAALLEDPESPCPEALLVMSPSVDLRRDNPEIENIVPHDPLLRQSFIQQTGDAWRADWSAEDTRISPIFSELQILARRGVHVHGVTGGYDILGPDAVLFREKCKEASVQGEWLEWDKQMHCFPLAFSFHLPESVEAKDWIVDVLKRA